MRKLLLRPEFVIFLLTAIFLLPLCDLIFQCGCSYLWSGADSHCNIHDPSKPNCPWCIAPFHNSTASMLVQMIPFLLIFLSACLSIRISHRLLVRGYFKQLAVGFAGGLISLLIFGWIYGKIYDYPYFLFK